MGFDIKTLFKHRNAIVEEHGKTSLSTEYADRCPFCGSKFLEKKGNMYHCLYCKKNADYLMASYLCKEIDNMLLNPQKNKYEIDAKKVRYPGIDWDGKRSVSVEINNRVVTKENHETSKPSRDIYLTKLEDAIRAKGEKLSDKELVEFGDKNELFTVYQLHISELRIDQSSIYRKISGSLEKKSNIGTNSAPTNSSTISRPEKREIPQAVSSSKDELEKQNHESVLHQNDKKIMSKEQYLMKIEDAIRRKGDKLSDEELIKFADKNELFSVHQIHISELRIDHAAVYRRISGSLKSNSAEGSIPSKEKTVEPETKKPISSIGISAGKNSGLTPSISAKTSSVSKLSREQYIKLLEEAVLRNGGGVLSSGMLFEFFRANKLDETMGLHISELESDMKSIVWKNRNRIFTSVSKGNMNGEGCDSKSTASKKSKDVVSKDARQKDVIKKKSIDPQWTTKEKQLAETVGKLLKDYPDLLDDTSRLKGALADVLVQQNREVFMLSALSASGILADIKRCSIMDEMLRDRYISTMENNYGTEKRATTKMILVWFYAYGQLILNKEAYTDF